MANAKNISSQARWIGSSPSQGNILLDRIKNYSEKDASSVETVKAVGVDKPVGHREKIGDVGIDFDVYIEEGDPEWDWYEIKRLKETFSLTKQYVNGQRFQYTGCRIVNIDFDGDEEGSHMGKVAIIALAKERL